MSGRARRVAKQSSQHWRVCPVKEQRAGNSPSGPNARETSTSYTNRNYLTIFSILIYFANAGSSFNGGPSSPDALFGGRWLSRDLSGSKSNTVGSCRSLSIAFRTAPIGSPCPGETRGVGIDRTNGVRRTTIVDEGLVYGRKRTEYIYCDEEGPHDEAKQFSPSLAS